MAGVWTVFPLSLIRAEAGNPWTGPLIAGCEHFTPSRPSHQGKQFSSFHRHRLPPRIKGGSIVSSALTLGLVTVTLSVEGASQALGAASGGRLSGLGRCNP